MPGCNLADVARPTWKESDVHACVRVCVCVSGRGRESHTVGRQHSTQDAQGAFGARQEFTLTMPPPSSAFAGRAETSPRATAQRAWAALGGGEGSEHASRGSSRRPPSRGGSRSESGGRWASSGRPRAKPRRVCSPLHPRWKEALCGEAAPGQPASLGSRGSFPGLEPGRSGSPDPAGVGGTRGRLLPPAPILQCAIYPAANDIQQ